MARKRTAKSCGPGAAMLASSLWRFPQVTVTTSPLHRGEHEVSRKAIAQGMSECFRCPVCSCAPTMCILAHETAGAARTRHSLRPLFGGRGNSIASLGRNARRECEVASSVIARSEATKQSISPRKGRMDCFASLAMTVAVGRCPARTARTSPTSPHPSHSTQDSIPYDPSSARQNAIKQNRRRKSAGRGGSDVHPSLRLDRPFRPADAGQDRADRSGEPAPLLLCATRRAHRPARRAASRPGRAAASRRATTPN